MVNHWLRPTAGASGFTDATGKLYFNANGISGADSAGTWYKYTYLFPNGGATDARIAIPNLVLVRRMKSAMVTTAREAGAT